MKLHKYRNYHQYRRFQTAKNRRQLDRVWATDSVLDAVAASVRKYCPGAKFGLCHGAKAGWEVNGLRGRLGIEVLGTDISETAAEFEHMLVWDFHEVKPEWLRSVDFIYSNCLDHSYDPELCLRRWISCLTPSGVAIVEWSDFHDPEHSTPDDPFGATAQEYHQLLSQFGRVREVLNVPAEPGHKYALERKLFVVGSANSAVEQRDRTSVC